MGKKTHIAELMETSGVKFGTSGARGRVVDMTDEVCYAYTLGFIQHLEKNDGLGGGDKRIALAGDLRASTDRIMASVGRAISDRGYDVVNCGKIPSPAVALFGLVKEVPAIMVTGSHIPDDRNGIKYNKKSGEILKNDEAQIKSQIVETPELFDDGGMLNVPYSLGSVDGEARQLYIDRYLNVFPKDCLAGLRIGLYEHSAVGRDMLHEIYTGLGASVARLERSDEFLPVDTEAIRPQDVELCAKWAKDSQFDAIVSTDGDSDRPLISDENGKWLRGDVAGVLCARYVKADVVVTPVSSNTLVEKCGSFERVARTRIGSPYVIAQMIDAAEKGAKRVVGYEANGGFLTGSAMELFKGALGPLPTRDTVIVHLAILCSAKEKQISVSKLLADLPQRFTASDRLKEFPREVSLKRIEELRTGGKEAIARVLPELGELAAADETDGLRMTFQNGEVVHLRPSGNAPELRCYSEADTEERARALNGQVIGVMKTWR